jgi:NDP-sugar pyrophosphorylase family protein
VILAGGKGTRLLPYTSVLPKPLLPVGDQPILKIVLRQLARSGVKRATLAVGHRADLFPQVLGRSTGALKLDYVRERTPLGTAAPLRHIPGLSSTFLVLNGDILTDLDFRALVKHHQSSGAAATIATYRRRVDVDFGVLKTNGSGRLVAYHEKPSLSYRVSMGIYVFEPRVIRHIPRRGRFDFPELIQVLLGASESVVSYPFSGRWLDIGRPDDFAAAQTEVARHPKRYL